MAHGTTLKGRARLLNLPGPLKISDNLGSL